MDPLATRQGRSAMRSISGAKLDCCSASGLLPILYRLVNSVLAALNVEYIPAKVFHHSQSIQIQRTCCLPKFSFDCIGGGGKYSRFLVLSVTFVFTVHNSSVMLTWVQKQLFGGFPPFSHVYWVQLCSQSPFLFFSTSPLFLVHTSGPPVSGPYKRKYMSVSLVRMSFEKLLKCFI